MLGWVLVLVVLALAVMGIVGWVVAVAESAPNLAQLAPRVPGQVSEVYAADGSLLGYIASDTLRSFVPGNQVPKLLREATVAIEDRRFYQHGGVDYYGIVRAGVRDLLGGGTGGLQGGSTLTMQLIGNIYLPNRIKAHHNLKYKIVQAKLANELEAHKSKAWILTQYLNDVPYGTVEHRHAIGVGAAAQMFFDKPVQDLDLAEIALLAGLPQAPSAYNPFEEPDLARARRHEVLAAMVQSGYITQAQEVAADAEPLGVRHNPTFGDLQQQPYLFGYIEQQLLQKLGQDAYDRGGLKIYTTINLRDQAYARHALLANEGHAGDPAAALVSIDPTNGHIVAMAQNTNYGLGTGETTFNYATQSQRQTGSSFKPFVLMTMIHDDNGDPNSTYYDSHELLPGWLPSAPTYHVQTSEHSYQGVINITKAMTISDNTVFAQLGVDVGMGSVDQMAHEMGITSPLFGYPAEAIGGLKIGVSPLQMSDAYSTIANGGQHVAPTIISRVLLPQGGLVDLGTPAPKRVFSEGQAYAATQVLQTVVQYGTGTAANYGCPAAGKTGTTSNYTDAWFVGYTPQLSTAVWVGFPHATTSMTDVNGLGPGFGGTLAAPIWHDFMRQAEGAYCGSFIPAAVAWYGQPYYGKHSVNGSAYTYTGPVTTTTATTTTTLSTIPSQSGGAPSGPGAATTTTGAGGVGTGAGGVGTGTTPSATTPGAGTGTTPPATTPAAGGTVATTPSLGATTTSVQPSAPGTTSTTPAPGGAPTSSTPAPPTSTPTAGGPTSTTSPTSTPSPPATTPGTPTNTGPGTTAGTPPSPGTATGAGTG